MIPISVEVQELNGFVPYFQLLAALLIGFSSINALRYFLEENVVKIIFWKSVINEHALHAYALERAQPYFKYFNHVRNTLLGEIYPQLINSAILCMLILILAGYQIFFNNQIFLYHFTIISGFGLIVFCTQELVTVIKCLRFKHYNNDTIADENNEPIIKKRYIWFAWFFIICLLIFDTYCQIFSHQRSIRHCLGLSLFMTIAPFLCYAILSLIFGFFIRKRFRSIQSVLDEYLKIQNDIQNMNIDVRPQQVEGH